MMRMSYIDAGLVCCAIVYDYNWVSRKIAVICILMNNKIQPSLGLKPKQTFVAWFLFLC